MAGRSEATQVAQLGTEYHGPRRVDVQGYLSLLMRYLAGVGTSRQALAGVQAWILAVFKTIRAVFGPKEGRWTGFGPRTARRPSPSLEKRCHTEDRESGSENGVVQQPAKALT